MKRRRTAAGTVVVFCDNSGIRIHLEQALDSLSELQRKVIYLFFYKDLCQTEIGRKLGLSQRKTSRTVASGTTSKKRRRNSAKAARLLGAYWTPRW